MTRTKRPAALITGGSRGIGAATAVAMAELGYDVAITYRNKEARASEVRAEIARRGVRALAVSCNMTLQDDIAALFGSLRQWAPHLDALVLNASGGLERDLLAADPHHPMRINRDAQLMMLDGALPTMRQGSVVVFVTSHWAHLYGRVEQMPAYAPVAESKHAGEQALRARQNELAERGARLVVVTADLVEGTITPKLMERMSPGLFGQRRAAIGHLPTTAEMGREIAASVADSALPNGHTVVVGGTLASLLL